MQPRRGLFGVSLLALAPGLVGTSSCAPQSSNNYAGAAIGAAVAVASVAALRAATGECWARCDKGQVCDRESGLCMRGECYPTCGWGQHCERLSTGLLCVPDPNAGVTFTIQAPPAPLPSAVPPPPAPSAAGTATQPAPATSLDPSWTTEPPAQEAEPDSKAPAEAPEPAEPDPDTWFTPPKD